MDQPLDHHHLFHLPRPHGHRARHEPPPSGLYTGFLVLQAERCPQGHTSGDHESIRGLRAHRREPRLPETGAGELGARRGDVPPLVTPRH